jgi:prepilin-type processing-associated H-X9-DG protein
MSKASQVYESAHDEGDRAAERVDLREWGAAVHVAVWSKPERNRLALVAAGFCAWSLLPWVLLAARGYGASPSPLLVAFLLPLPLVGALVSGLAYRRGRPPRFAGRGVAAATLFVHGIHLTFLALSLAWAGASEPGNRLGCASHLRRIGQSLTFYAVKYDTKYPPTLDLLILHADTPAEVFACPSAGGTYAYAAADLSAESVTRDHVLAYDRPDNHAGAGINVLFGDGNVRWLERAEAEHLTAELNAGHNPPR